MSFILRGLNRLREVFSGARSKGVLLPAWRTVYGEAPAVTFEDLVNAYTKDVAAKAAVDFLSDEAVGMGFYTTVNEEYERAEKVKDLVDDFNEQVDLDGLLQIGVREIVAFGNSFWEKVEPEKLEDLRVLPMTSIDKISRDKFGTVEGYKQTAMYGGNTLNPKRVIHWRWNPIDGEAFGTGLLRALLEELTLNVEKRMSFLEMKARIEKVMPEVFEKYAGPDELWVFPDVSSDKLTEYQSLIKSKPKAGARFVTDKADADIKTVAIDPRARYDGYVEHIWNQFILGLQTPLPKLFTTPGFTEASARAAIEVAERKVMALQRFVKRIVEREIFWPVIEQVGLDPVRADCRLNWGMPEAPEIELEDVVRLAEISATTGIQYVRPDEVRKILIKMGFELTEAEAPETVEKKAQRRV